MDHHFGAYRCGRRIIVSGRFMWRSGSSRPYSYLTNSCCCGTVNAICAPLWIWALFLIFRLSRCRADQCYTVAYDLCGTVDPCSLADRCARMDPYCMAIVCVTLNSYPPDVCHWETILLGQSAAQWNLAVFLIFVE